MTNVVADVILIFLMLTSDVFKLEIQAYKAQSPVFQTQKGHKKIPKKLDLKLPFGLKSLNFGLEYITSVYMYV